MKKNQGFTLVELLIVVAILFILASIVKGAWAHFTGNGVGVEVDYRPTQAVKVEDHPDLTNCKELKDGEKSIYSCPDGKVYTK